MTTPLITPDNPEVLFAFIAAGAATAIWLEQTYKWAAHLSGPVIALLIAMLLSNFRVLPTAAPVYEVVELWMVPLAIPLLLARANLREIVRSGRGPLIAVNLAAIGTLAGTAVAVLLFRPWISTPDLEHAAGLMTASYVGGGVNFFAVKSSYNIPTETTGPLLVADNFVMVGFFVMILGLAASRWFRARYPHPHIAAAESGDGKNSVSEHWERKGISLLDIAKAMAFAFTVVALALSAQKVIKAAYGDVSQTGAAMQMLVTLTSNKFVLLTAISLIFATVLAKPLSKVNGMDEFGSWMLMMFLFVIGLPANLMEVLEKSPLFFPFCAVIAIGNVGFALLAGKFLKVNLEELLLAMNATLGGPPTAAAMAVSAGWPKLVLPGLLIGLWGYVIGTPLAIMVIEFLLKKPA